MTAYPPAELADAFARSPLGRPAGLTLDEALRNPALRRVLEIGAGERRQLARDLAARADRTTAGRLLDTTALDDYERCDRESHVMEEAW